MARLFRFVSPSGLPFKYSGLCAGERPGSRRTTPPNGGAWVLIFRERGVHGIGTVVFTVSA